MTHDILAENKQLQNEKYTNSHLINALKFFGNRKTFNSDTPQKSNSSSLKSSCNPKHPFFNRLFGEKTTISYVKIWNHHPIETTIYSNGWPSGPRLPFHPKAGFSRKSSDCHDWKKGRTVRLRGVEVEKMFPNPRDSIPLPLHHVGQGSPIL